jgi:hypothetical protein
MAVELSLDRKAVEITWDASALNGKKVTIKCVNPANEDVSTRKTENDGRAVVTFPKDYSGETKVTVSDSAGNEETGTVSV